MAKLNIKLVKSLAGVKKDQVATVKSMGLKRIGDISVQLDNEPTQGKIKKVVHLIEVTKA